MTNRVFPQNSSDNNQGHRIALCLGAHRSGTSLLAAAVEAVGATLALPDRGTSEENRKGFFEHIDIVALDEDLLRLAGSAWDDGLFESHKIGSISRENQSELQSRAHLIVETQLRRANLSAIKDPRMCRLLPFWFPVLNAAGYATDDIRCVIVTRDPVEIAISQRTRCRRNPDYYDFGQNLAEGVVLWLSHIRQALRDCTDHKILIIAYRDFLERPTELVNQIARFLDAHPDQGMVDSFVSQFVTKSLWRSHADDAATAEINGVFPGLLEAERGLAALSGRSPSSEELKPILTALYDPAFDTVAKDIIGRAYGRLSAKRRAERQEALQVTHALEVERQARQETTEEAQKVEGNLRNRIEETTKEAQKVEGNLRNRIEALKAGVSDRDRRLDVLRNEQDTAIRQLAAAFDRNEQELDQTRQRIAILSAELQDRKMENAGLRASRSWRLTRPLRAAGTAARSLRALPQTGLRRLNRTSKVTYQRLKRSHPQTAEVLRSVMQPLMLRANMKLLGQYSVSASAVVPLSDPPESSLGSSVFDYQYPQAHHDYRPLVTIIVPNYNHAPYLEQRLESIYAQTYENYEVLLLDDCSSDDSHQVLSNFAARYPDRTRLLFNEENSGGVFHQWEKGLSASRGELVWIAESDDWASPNFLETLVPFFENEAIQLAYAKTIFMDKGGDKQIWSMEDYLHQFSPERWNRAWVETASRIVRDVFSMINIIPNVSSALFRRFERLDVLEIDEWRRMRTCGDWMFYLNAIRGGMMAYSPDAQNFYRIHDTNTSTASHKADQFYCEHEAVAKCVRRHYRVPPENLIEMDTNLRSHWQITRNDYSESRFSECFDRKRIEAAPERKPGLLMVGYAFCSGGGEAFPIQLANEMKAFGYEVTFLDCAQEERITGVRERLQKDIPVISAFPDLRRIVQNFDVDLIHSHHGWSDNTVLDILPEDDRCRTIITLHGFYETMPSRALRLLLPRLMRRTAAIVYIAEKNLGVMQSDGMPVGATFHRIDNAVTRAPFTPIERGALGIAKDAFVLVLVSRAMHAKGWAEAIAATSRAREISGKDIHLVLVGEGEAKDAAETVGVPAHVHLEGFRSNTQDYFAMADLGFLPSRFTGESFPLVVIESLIVGTPVLASDIGEIRYMLTSDAGMAGRLFLLDEGLRIDIELLAETIADLATDANEMAELRACVPAAAKRFDPRRMAANYDAVYCGAASAGR